MLRRVHVSTVKHAGFSGNFTFIVIDLTINLKFLLGLDNIGSGSENSFLIVHIYSL